MRILLNISTPRKGGPLQRALSFLGELARDTRGHQWHAVISPVIQDGWGKSFALPFPYDVLLESPARHRSSRQGLRAIERSFRPECVYTFSGPAYVAFQAPHLLGCSDGWVTHPTPLALRAWSFPWERTKIRLESFYKSRWMRQADGWVVQTDSARLGLQALLRDTSRPIWVVPNSCAESYRSHPRRSERPLGDPVRYLCFAASYKHKRLDMIPQVAAHLRGLQPRQAFEFWLTLPLQDRLWKSIEQQARRLSVSPHIRNVGVVPAAEGPRLYEQTDIAFLPTVLETFSASYPEAMAMGMPIVTSGLSFARDTCADAAEYFVAGDTSDAARALARVTHDPQRRSILRERGYRVLERLPTQAMIVDACIHAAEELADAKPSGLTETHPRNGLES